jgi:hypothetical protein
MSTFQLVWGGNNLVDITVDIANIRGVGGPVFPRLVVPLKLHFNAWDRYQLIFRDASAQLATQDGKIIADAAPRVFSQVVTMSFGTHHQLEFQLDHYRIESIETQRGSQSFLPLQLHFQTSAEIVFMKKEDLKPAMGEGIFPLAGTVHFQIPSNTWCDHVAPGLGIGLVKIFELPAVPLSEIEDYTRAFGALEKAQKHFGKGDYDDAVAECRKAIEPLRQHLKKEKQLDPSILPADYADKIGAATTEWLQTMLGKTHGVSSALHHSTSAHFSRLDAQMVLTITANLVAYILRTAKK